MASAVGMSAVVFHDHAVRFWQNQKKPERWGHAAHAYIARTLFEGHSIMSWTGAGPMALKNKISGYAEGPHYFAYSFQAMFPFMKTYYQGIGIKSLYDESDQGGREYWPCALCVSSVKQEPYNSKSYLNLYEWYRNILLPNQEPPTLEDTWKKPYPFTGISLVGNPENNPFVFDYSENFENGLSNVGEPGYDLRIDYLLTQNFPKKADGNTPNIEYKDAGDLIIRGPNQYLHVNAEPHSATKGKYHEHGDVTSFIIEAGKSDILAMDPPYLGEATRSDVRKGKQHNVITIDNKGPNKKDDAIYSSLLTGLTEPNGGPNGDLEVFSEVNVKATYWKYFLGLRVGQKATINRSIEVHNYDYPFYVINDLVKNISLFEYPAYFNINGDGEENSTGTFEKINDNTFLWKRPCLIDSDPTDNWKMYSTTFTSDSWPDAQPYFPNSNPINGSNGDVLQYHTRASAGQVIPSGEEKHFTTIIEVIPCNSSAKPLKEARLTPKFTLYRTAPSENIVAFHLSHDILPKAVDTVIDPFRINSTAVLYTDASFSFFHYSTNKEFKSGNCTSNSNFRIARMTNGRLLKYHDTTYLSATKFSTSYYSLVGKCKYKAYIETDTACSVSFYLADVEKGIGMKVNDLSYTYDTNTCIITVSVPVGFTQFEIELEDPCRVSCFFPSTAETIHETFDFNQGVTATLGHKLDIVQPNGFLNISNGSHMMLCDGIYLRNRDSLILNSNCGKDTGQLTITSCDGRVKGTPYGSIGGTGGGAMPSKITVNAGAALILDNNSFTQISNNSELHVFGSLVIKNGAKILIGDQRTCSYATIMVYPGAYIHIEDSANLEFFKIVGDTQDKHVFFIANQPIGAAAKKGVAPSILNLLQNDTILSSSNIPVDICDLNTVTPPFGIANRDWGFCNVLAPVARIKLPSDTICLGDCPKIDFTSCLNDPIRDIEVCRIDTILGAAVLNCFDSKLFGGGSVNLGYNEGTSCYSSEVNMNLFPLCRAVDSTNRWYQIHVTVKNHCNLQDTQTVFFYVGHKPNAIISVDENACPGYGTVNAYNLSTFNAEKAIWHVHAIDSSQYQDNDENRSYYGGDWELNNLHYGDTFLFPDLNWIGGIKYAVNLTQTGYCGESISNWDTVEIQPGAKIWASPATVYSNPLGPSALKLQAFIGNASSFTWTPTTYLDNSTSLSPIATPNDTITYILSAFKDACAAYDTLSIKVNTLAFAGYADTVCNEPVLLGTEFDASLFFAYQYYENPAQVWSIISPYLGNDSSFFDKFSMYFLSEYGKNALQSNPTYMQFLGNLNRGQFYSQEWFINYFMNYHNQHKYQEAFDTFFYYVDANNTLKNYIFTHSMFTQAALQDIIEKYQNECYNNSAVQLNTVWEKYTQNGSNWESLGQWDNQIKIWDSVSVPTTYKITVIDNANSKVEFDQVEIWSDQTIVPSFYVQFQTDSTLYFSNISEPTQATTTYLWNFGDGTTSNQVNPVHTFPYFDSSYVVCLTANNLCGTANYCDTLRVDSNGLGMYSKIQIPKPTIGNTIQSGFKAEGITLIAFPNPFSSEVNIAYQITQEYTKAKLQLTDYLGKELQSYLLPNTKGTLALPMQDLSAGLYTYQLILDGRLVQTGKLVKE